MGVISNGHGSPSQSRKLEEQAQKLVEASSAGDIPHLEALLEAVQDLNRDPAHLPTDGFLLQTAAKQGQAECIRFLFERLPGCVARPNKRWDPPLPDGYSCTDIPDKWHVYEDGVIHEAIGGKDPVGLFRVFFNYGMNPNVGLGYAGSPLAQAVSSNQLPLTEYLLARGADPNGTYMCSSLLGVAARQPTDDVLRALVAHGALVPGSQALQQAAHYWRARTAETLLGHGADINEVFAREEYDDSMQLVRVPLGCALHFAVEGGMRRGGPAEQSDFVRFLLGRGARTDLVNDRGETPVQMAERLGKTSIVDVIQSRGVDE
ncbi:ankyrin repeat protein [Metarhizium robertsii]|uniref:Ankyrin repeat protein n=2 Tax=Metarhizium robertsii TaxID=568076 RepID=E9F7X5_METRA|nr:ankyrin repeat protein [Metarhizium robertsii ARSEF 23]EFY96263.2 ankyrin repeat protein [Metarhizium robertsii ARSEF 23]EXU98531.1 ankyrin repeat protein [Metarhizium robertsii]